VSPVLPLWFEIVSMVVLVVILLVDLLLIIRRPHVPSMREASLWVGFYVLLALIFAGLMFLLGDAQHGTEFLAGWLTEYSLSIDNLFVFVLILASFKVPHAYQQRALMIGIVLALIFRGLFILAGAALIEARAIVGHGGWSSWLAESAIPQRSAQRYMALARGGPEPATVADLGLAEAARLAGLGHRLWPKDDRIRHAEGLDGDHFAEAF